MPSTRRSAERLPGSLRRLRTAESELKELPNYRSFLACGRDHCAFDRSTFYSTTTGGVRLRDWVADLEAGKDVTCPECEP